MLPPWHRGVAMVPGGEEGRGGFLGSRHRRVCTFQTAAARWSQARGRERCSSFPAPCSQESSLSGAGMKKCCWGRFCQLSTTPEGPAEVRGALPPPWGC